MMSIVGIFKKKTFEIYLQHCKIYMWIFIYFFQRICYFLIIELVLLQNHTIFCLIGLLPIAILKHMGSFFNTKWKHKPFCGADCHRQKWVIEIGIILKVKHSYIPSTGKKNYVYNAPTRNESDAFSYLH